MYCHSPQVNQLTALLVAHGVERAVVCPGSRNGVVVHNLHALQSEGRMQLTAVTDERSAAFVALGMTLATQQAVAVCVTSGSALLACLPAVAEAYYRHLPLLVISADRPQEWIGQWDGQTLPQHGALMPYCPTHTLAAADADGTYTDAQRWLTNRLANEALLALSRQGGGPAHINVPVAEPLFRFTTPHLPHERMVRRHEPQATQPLPAEVVQLVAGARLPALVVGQYERGDLRAEVAALTARRQMLVLPDIIADVEGSHRLLAFDRMDATAEADCLPDVVVHLGGNFVCQRFKALLRQAEVQVVRLGYDEGLADTFCHLTHTVRCGEQAALQQLAAALPPHNPQVARALQRLEALAAPEPVLQPAPQGAYVWQTLSQALAKRSGFTLHLGNSLSIRLAARYLRSGLYPILANRGTNGIEGSLSAAVGYATAMWGLSIVVLGDLSFFYDANALWNVALPPNLRILLVNNGRGGIFDHLPGLSQSPASKPYIAAGGQHFDAQGIAQAFHVDYHRADATHALPEAIEAWLGEGERAKLLEVRTDD